MQRISDYVATLSAAEREQFRALIEETTAREMTVQQNMARADLALLELAAQHQHLSTKIRDLELAGQRLLETVSRLYLRTTPTPSTLH